MSIETLLQQPSQCVACGHVLTFPDPYAILRCPRCGKSAFRSPPAVMNPDAVCRACAAPLGPEAVVATPATVLAQALAIVREAEMRKAMAAEPEPEPKPSDKWREYGISPPLDGQALDAPEPLPQSPRKFDLAASLRAPPPPPPI